MTENKNITLENELKTGLYSICDRVAGFNNVMTIRGDAVAIRSFKQIVMQKGSVLQENPEDYVLVKIGTLEVNTGKIEPCYEELCEAWDVIKQYKLTANSNTEENKQK